MGDVIPMRLSPTRREELESEVDRLEQDEVAIWEQLEKIQRQKERNLRLLGRVASEKGLEG